eukprot:TRINITY_DN9263_c0_g1_i1.p1 TRINITY_DN9263_c0_g1~~TRINITY_DN9263_c0_g1_i1.p1  ORF type:complete len:621 (-),score=146.75 TRINITY_DN9263_c0_g1_i1:51-1913(-)
MEDGGLQRRLATSGQYDVAWLVLFGSVGLLFLFDVFCLQTSLGTGRMSFQTAGKLTLFWIVIGLFFNLFVFVHLGWFEAVGYLQGYLLEYMLGFDNLFVFHLVFSYYCTPEPMVYRALYYGILGAMVLRVLFFVIGNAILGSGFYFFKFSFGVLLIWSGVKTMSELEDEESMAKTTNTIFIDWVSKYLPVSDSYEPHGYFFITVSEVEERPDLRSMSTTGLLEAGELGEAGLLRGESFAADFEASGSNIAPSSALLPRLESFEGGSLLAPTREAAMASARSATTHGGSSSSSSKVAEGLLGSGEDSRAVAAAASAEARRAEYEAPRKPARLRRKASLLLLVVVAVWVVDIVFAVDSVASKLASVDNLFLNCASSAFAMLSLRSLYFVMESLVEMFNLLKYGIGAILVLIGLKLIFAEWLSVSNAVCFSVILAICAASMASSYWMPSLREDCERINLGPMDSAGEANEEEFPELRSELIAAGQRGAGSPPTLADGTASGGTSQVLPESRAHSLSGEPRGEARPHAGSGGSSPSDWEPAAAGKRRDEDPAKEQLVDRPRAGLGGSSEPEPSAPGKLLAAGVDASAKEAKDQTAGDIAGLPPQSSFLTADSSEKSEELSLESY